MKLYQCCAAIAVFMVTSVYAAEPHELAAGSFVNSCKACSVTVASGSGHEFLNCECKTGELDKTRNSVWKRSSVNMSTCASGVFCNNHGQLQCNEC